MRRTLLAVLLAVTAAVAVPVNGTAQPATTSPSVHDREPGNGPERNEIAALDEAFAAQSVPAQGENQADRYQGYPRRTKLRSYPENPADKSIKLDLAPYHSLAPKLNALQQKSNRVSVEVVGQSGLGRDLYLVTLTAPESPVETRIQERFRASVEEGRNVPAGLYKAPIWINNNIHGDEWEGTDGALRVIEHLATSNDRETQNLLRRSRIYFNLTANPDGRVAGTRANSAGFDLNRDFVTNSQPENRAMQEIVERTQPLMMLDEHGYVANTLIEPTTPPHGQNYDFDLYIKHGYAGGLLMEKGVQALGHPEAAKPEIPFRDYPVGEWDGWAPIYTAQYAMYHGAVSYTIEIPMRVNRGDYDTLPAAELQRRSKINTDVVEATIKTTLDYVDDNRRSLIANQTEMFRRGAAGEAQRHIPDGFVPGFGPEDRFRTEFPRAYVITDDRSAPATARLVDQLVRHDVRVERAEKPFTLGGKRYPAGSYVVDMHQPKRGLANVMLEQGSDISDKAPVMYDISAGATGCCGARRSTCTAAASSGSTASRSSRPRRPVEVNAAPGADLALVVNDQKDVNAVNDLLSRGIELRRQDNGTIVVPAREGSRREGGRRPLRRAVHHRQAGRHGVAAQGGRRRGRPGRAAGAARVRVRGPHDLHRRAERGLRLVADRRARRVVRPATTTSSTPPPRPAMDEFLKRGGVVTRGATGGRFNVDARLLAATPGRRLGGRQRRGVNGQRQRCRSARVRCRTSFVYAPQWFTDLGAGVASNSGTAATPLVAGHWRPRDDGSGGQHAAAGQAAVVSGTSANGAKVVLFGTEPMFRDHPKGLYAQFARAIFWSGTR